MSKIRARACIAALVATLSLSACTQILVLETPLQSLSPASLASAPNSASWWDIAFRLQWDAEQAPNWYMDALLADRVCAPAISAHESRISLWRFHRRAAADAAGHQFRLSIYTDNDSADLLYEKIRSNALLQVLQSAGQVIKLHMSKVDRPPRPPIAQTSDPAWPQEVQASWPYFIMGVSQMWLKLIEAVREQNPRPAHPDLATVIDRYQGINERVNALWREQGQHAYLHHLNALFGYQPLVIRETNLKRF